MFILADFFHNFRERLNGEFSPWTIFGLVGNVLFTSRFVVQWYASEKLGQSVIPKNFWRLSLLGGVVNFVYALHIGASPIILGAILPPVIAARNLMLIARGNQPKPPRTAGQPLAPGTIDDGGVELDGAPKSPRP